MRDCNYRGRSYFVGDRILPAAKIRIKIIMPIAPSPQSGPMSSFDPRTNMTVEPIDPTTPACSNTFMTISCLAVFTATLFVAPLGA